LSSDSVRANLIRQIYERSDTRDLEEVLMDLEAEPGMRLEVARALTESIEGTGRGM
jgi:hypothetical protein